MNDVWEYKRFLPDTKVIIWGIGKRSITYAIRLINHNIRFDYFLYDGTEKIKTAYLLNKKVIDLEYVCNLSKEYNAAVLTDTEQSQRVREKCAWGGGRMANSEFMFRNGA